MKKVILLIYMLVFSLSLNVVFAHGDEEHKEQQQDTLNITEVNEMQEHHASEDTHSMMKESMIVDAKMDDFSSLHPLIVHFPIVLLLLAFLAQLLAFFFWQKELSWVTFILLTGGFLGAYIASTYVHPHTAGLTDAATKVLNMHDLYADYTLWLSGIGLLLKAVTIFLFKDKRWLEIIIVLLLAGAAYSVSQAGHYGATLTHIHGVGAQGNFIESAADGHNHSH